MVGRDLVLLQKLIKNAPIPKSKLSIFRGTYHQSYGSKTACLSSYTRYKYTALKFGPLVHTKKLHGVGVEGFLQFSFPFRYPDLLQVYEASWLEPLRTRADGQSVKNVSFVGGFTSSEFEILVYAPPCTGVDSKESEQLTDLLWNIERQKKERFELNDKIIKMDAEMEESRHILSKLRQDEKKIHVVGAKDVNRRVSMQTVSMQYAPGTVFNGQDMSNVFIEKKHWCKIRDKKMMVETMEKLSVPNKIMTFSIPPAIAFGAGVLAGNTLSVLPNANILVTFGVEVVDSAHLSEPKSRTDAA
jgi:hypothetical protein